MIPRGNIYVGWGDVAAAAVHCCVPRDRDAAEREAATLWHPDAVATLSVRSALDALLGELAFPRGSEAVISAITIPHILEILAHHGIVPVPVDVDPETLSVDAAEVRAACTAQTRIVMVAHLFGSRMPLDSVVEVARAQGALLIEDCAQSNDGSGYRGHPGSDVALFSFGAIKRQSALGGGVAIIRDPALRERVRARQGAYPSLPALSYARRLATLTGVRVAGVPWVFDAFVTGCHLGGLNHDAVLGRALRGFSGGNLLARLRHHPGSALLGVLARRLRQDPRADVAARVRIVEATCAAFPALPRFGAKAAFASHWLFPARSAQPEAMTAALWRAGFDATRGASNLCVVPAPAGRATAPQAERLLQEVVYLPLHPAMTDADCRRMAGAVRAHVSHPS